MFETRKDKICTGSESNKCVIANVGLLAYIAIDTTNSRFYDLSPLMRSKGTRMNRYAAAGFGRAKST